MSETQQHQNATSAPQLKAVDNSPAPMLSAARRVARKAINLAAISDSLAPGGAAAGEEMVAGGVDKKAAAEAPAKGGTPAAVAQEGFSGTPVALPHLAKMEASFGRSFGNVRAYTDAAARKATDALGAKAYAVGDQIAFNSPSPSEELVAHELTHVVQAQQGRVQAAGADGGEGIETSGEAEAEKVESAVASGKPARSALEGGDVDAAATGEKKAGPSLSKTGRPARSEGSKFAMGMSFSTEAMEKSYQYELWKANPPIEIPIVAVPGLNFMVEPSVIIKAAGGVNWKEKALTANLGVEGVVGVGLSYGNAAVASIYGVMEAHAAGGFEYKRSDAEWELAGSIGLSTNFRVGVKLAGGIMDYGFDFGKVEIGKLVGMSWKNGKFSGPSWEWGPKIKEFFAAVKTAIDKAKQVIAAGQAALDAAAEAARRGRQVFNAGRDAVNWVTSW